MRGRKTLLLVLALIPALASADRLCKPREATDNDRHVMWLVRGGDYFVDAGTGDGTVATNPELLRLDNPKVTFAVKKPPRALRIFCIGGSTTRGWPFHRATSYPALLAMMLRDLLPDQRCEVINAGFMASDSWSDLGLARQIMRFSPDLILVYEGRNESWNLPLHQGLRSRLLRAHLWLLQHVRLWSRLRDHSATADRGFDQAQAVRNWAARTQPAGDAARSLQRNLGAMWRQARGHGCRMALLTQVASPDELESNPGIFEINAGLRDFAAREHLPLIDLEQVFRRRWTRPAEYLIPSPIMHPDLMGYVLMARSVARGLADHGLVADSRSWRWSRLRADAAYAESAGLAAAERRVIYRNLGTFFARAGSPAAARIYFERSRRR